MQKLNKLLYFVLTFTILTFINICSSNVISEKLASGWIFNSPLFRLVYIENTGAAFSILQNSTKFLIILSVIALCVIFVYIIKNLNRLSVLSIIFVSFLISGILGNLYERFLFGFVRDFFDLTFVNFPIFNISDIFINIGVLGIIILVLLTKKNNINIL